MRLSDWLLVTFLLVTAVLGWLLFLLFTEAHIDPPGAPFLRAVLIIGLVTMALLQTLKRLSPARRHFHEGEIKKWLSRVPAQAANSNQVAASEKLGNNPSKLAENRLNALYGLAVASSSSVFLDLPIEQVCGQITAAVEGLLEYPSGDEQQNLSNSPIAETRTDLIEALAGEAGQSDVQSYQKALAELIESPPVGREDVEKKYFAARNRVSQRFQRNIDALQIQAGIAWRRRMWIWALVTGTVLAFVASNQIKDWPSRTFFFVTAGLTGGFVATVARDLTAAVERFRR